MSFTNEQVQDEVGKFLQRSPSISQPVLGNASENREFQRVRETILLSIGTRPEVLFYLRYLGRNRLLSQLRTCAENISNLLISMSASTVESRGKADTTALRKAHKAIQQASLGVLRGGTVSTASYSIAKYRRELGKYVTSIARDAREPVGDEARRFVSGYLDRFVDQYRTLILEFWEFMHGPSVYDPERLRRALSYTAVDRATQAMNLARVYYDSASKPQAKASSYALNAIGASSSLKTIERFRELDRPLLRSRRPASLDQVSHPSNTSFLGRITGEATPATAPSSTPTGKNPSLTLAANGAAPVVVAFSAAGKWFMHAGVPKLGYTGKWFHFDDGSLYTIPLTNNPATLAVVVGDIQAGLPAGAVAQEVDGRLVITHTSQFTLPLGESSANRLLGFDTGLAASEYVTAELAAAEIEEQVSGVLVEVEEVIIGDKGDDGRPYAGVGQSAGTDWLTSGISSEVQEGDLLVVRSGGGAGTYVITAVSGGTDLVTEEPVPREPDDHPYYIVSRRVKITSTDTTTASELDITASTVVGLPVATHKGKALYFEAVGKNEAGDPSAKARFKLYGISAGDILSMRNGGRDYEATVIEVDDELLSLDANNIDCDLVDAEFEINAPMRSSSSSLTRNCRAYLASRRKRFPYKNNTLPQFKEKVDLAVNSPGQLSSRIRGPMKDLADLLVSMVVDVPLEDEVLSAMRRQGLEMPPAPSYTMEGVLLSFEDNSPAPIKERGNAILQTLEDRGYDRARSLLLTGQTAAFAELKVTGASHGASMMDNMRKIASTMTRSG